MYIQPPADAIAFALSRSGYIQPPNTAVNFELTREGSIIPSVVPGVIVSVGTPWGRSPDRKHVHLTAPFGASLVRDALRHIDTGSTAWRNDQEKALVFGATRHLDDETSIDWGSVPGKEITVHLPHEQAGHRDIEYRRIQWAEAAFQLESQWAAPFLVKTPWKDREITGSFESSDLLSPLRRRNEVAPGPLAKPVLGQAHLELSSPRVIENENLYELAGKFGLLPTQPKDTRFFFIASQGRPRDIKRHIPWGPAGARDTTLDFDYDDYPGPIDFPDTITIPTLRFYVVANSAQIVRVSDGVDVPASQVSLSISTDQYTWNFRATLAKKSAKALIEGADGEPVEVDVHINNNVWRILVDFWDERLAWSRNTITISGRSRSAFLAAPYATPRDYTEDSGLLAQQLAAQELPFGWDLEWNATDWFVPAGAWRYQKLTPMQAIARLAAAAGAFVRPDLLTDKLYVESLYPASPWNLVDLGPDFQMPHDVMLQRTSRKVPGVGANGVYVFGGAVSPYHAEVIRRQTNGLPLAEQVVDDLVTDRNPAEALGIVALAGTGRQALETYELPLSDALGGLIPLGSLIEVGADIGGTFLPDWRGLIRAVAVDASATRGNNGGVSLTVRQSVDLVRHFDEDI